MAKIKVNITLDEELMRRVDEYAEENYLNRSSLVSLATTQFLNAADVTKAIKEMAFAMRKIADNGEIDDESEVILEPQKIKSDTVSTVSPSISHEVMGPDV